MRHNLKIEQRWLDSVANGRKKAEIRRADRSFSVGDELLLYTPDKTDAEIAIVTHVLSLEEIPGYDGGPFVSLSVEPVRRLCRCEIADELERGSFGER